MTSQYIAPRSKLFAHLPTLEAIRRGEKPAPINVELDISFRCDYRCQNCHFAYTHTRGPWAGKVDKPEGAIDGGDLMDYDLACRIFDQLATYGVKSLTFTGGGEPSIHPRFDDIIKRAHSVGLELGIYTHGSFITDDRAAWMKKHFKWIYISFDAHDAESYKAHKGVNRFAKVCANIKRLVALEGDATIGMGFLIHNDNWKQIHEMARLGRNLGVDYVQFRPLVLHESHDPGAKQDADTTWALRATGRLNAYKGDSFVVADIARFEEYANWRGHGYQQCYFSALQTVITPNGKAWRCTNKREYPDGLLGDLSTESFADMWERSGGTCMVNDKCRIFCRGHSSNQTLQGVMQEHHHRNFV